LVPLIFTFSRQVMLEMPALACALAAIYHFHRYLDQRRRRDLFLAALASALCALTRFDAVYLLPLFLIMMGLRGELRLLWRKEVLLAAALALMLVAPAYIFALVEIGWGHLRSIEAGNKVSAGFMNLKNLQFYIICLPRQIGWFALVAACFGVL